MHTCVSVYVVSNWNILWSARQLAGLQREQRRGRGETSERNKQVMM